MSIPLFFTQFVGVIVDLVMTIIGPILATFAVALILFVTYAWFSSAVPSIIADHGTSLGIVLTLIGFWILCNLLYNYAMTYYKGPGHPPDTLDDDRKALLSDDPALREGMVMRYCKDCQCVKPMRTHHCSMCKKCVLKMDHHCPWVNTCVGYKNHKHFVLFLHYLWSGAGFFIICTFKQGLAALFGIGRHRNQRADATFMFASIMCFSAFIASMLFYLWNLYLVATNQTTIEFYGNVFDRASTRYGRNVFNLGLQRNFSEVFGYEITIFNWFLPSQETPYGDGIIYPMILTPGGPIKNERRRPGQQQEVLMAKLV